MPDAEIRLCVLQYSHPVFSVTSTYVSELPVVRIVLQIKETFREELDFSQGFRVAFLKTKIKTKTRLALLRHDNPEQEVTMRTTSLP